MPHPLLASITKADMQLLEQMEGATHLQMPPGQVLVYREHRSPGVFVVFSGRIEVPDERGQKRPSPHRMEALPGRPILIPGPDAVEEPFADTWAVGDTAKVLYLPRTLIRDSSGLKERLRKLACG